MTITAAQKAVFRLPRRGMGDTAAAHCRVIHTVFGGLAEFDRDLIRTYTGERRGQARGVKLGRKPKLTEDQRPEALRRRDGEPVREMPAPQYQSQHNFKAHSLRDGRKSTRAGCQDRVRLCEPRITRCPVS